MRAVIQRVSLAEVHVNQVSIARIHSGLLMLVGFMETDNQGSMEYIANKSMHLRIFEDTEGKMNLSVLEMGGEILVVPNFTLYGDCRHGRRPSYSTASSPETARSQFEQFCELFKKEFPKIQFGQFQADMKVNIMNDGPVTLLLDSEKQF